MPTSRARESLFFVQKYLGVSMRCLHVQICLGHPQLAKKIHSELYMGCLDLESILGPASSSHNLLHLPADSPYVFYASVSRTVPSSNWPCFSYLCLCTHFRCLGFPSTSLLSQVFFQNLGPLYYKAFPDSTIGFHYSCSLHRSHFSYQNIKYPEVYYMTVHLSVSITRL